MEKYQPTIGLEIHVELKTNSKMFCSCKNDSNERHPNVNICPVCMGHPGVLPVINGEAVRRVLRVGLALNCHIPERSKFDRKNYFYPDLPKGYQISQYDMPLCGEGFLEINGRKIKIRRVHLEEDTGRLLHPALSDFSLVDFNRAGIPLMELVTEPDIKSAMEARNFAEELQLILRYLLVYDANMEKGEMRCEVNLSLAKDGAKKLGTKVEIKNLNSFKSVERALEYELARQKNILVSAQKIIQETRGWDDGKGETFSQRTKEEAHDYRYFPEPDLPPLFFKKEEISKIKAEIPELPQARRGRFKKEYNLLDGEINIFIQNKELGEYFEKSVSELGELAKEPNLKSIKLCANYMITDLQGLLGGESVGDEDFKITPENFAEFISLIYSGKVSSKIAKVVLDKMFKTGADPSRIIEEEGLTQLTDQGELEKIAKEIIAKNQKAVDDLKKGKESSLQFLVGQVLAATRGKANPVAANETLKKLLSL